MTDLGTLGGTSSQPVGINEAGQVIGFATTAGNAEQHAFVWDSVGGMTDLGTFGGTISYAQALNEAGQVIGFATTVGNAEQHAWS
jgi:probable HAF family extracellular repeat protein